MLHTPIDLQGEVADVHNAGAVVGEGGLVGDPGDMVGDTPQQVDFINIG